MTEREEAILEQIRHDLTESMKNYTFNLEKNNPPLTPYEFLNDLARAHMKSYLAMGWITVEPETHSIYFINASENFSVDILSTLPLAHDDVPEKSDIEWKVYDNCRKLIGTAIFQGRKDPPPPDATNIPVGVITSFTFAEPIRVYHIDIDVEVPHE